MVTSLIVLLLAQAAAPAVATGSFPLEPNGEWIRKFGPDHCELAREFGAGDHAMMLIITPRVDSKRFSFTLLRHGKRRSLTTNTATLTLLPSGMSVAASRTSAAASDGHYDRSDLFVGGARQEWGDLPSSDALRIDDGEGSVTLIMAGFAPELTALNECHERALTEMGFDVGAWRAIVSGPEPANNPVRWITNDDYPVAALRARLDGTVDATWTVDTTGKVVGCRITKGPHLDVFGPLLCTLAPSRARFRPARDANGKAVTSQFRYRFTFNLPR